MIFNHINQKEIRSVETPLVSLASFARSIGRTPVTLWRWQRQGWLGASINIAGKPYLTREAIDCFVQRATAGEFSKKPHVPRKEKMLTA